MTHTQITCPNHIALLVGKKGARPDEVGVLAPVFEKSATERKLKQKLLKCKSTLQKATLDVKTFNRIDQLPELTSSVIDYNIYVIYIQEHRYRHSEDIKYHDTGNGWAIVLASAWKTSVNAAI